MTAFKQKVCCTAEIGKSSVLTIGAYLIVMQTVLKCIKISPIFYIANANPNPTGPSTPHYGNYPPKLTDVWSA